MTSHTKYSQFVAVCRPTNGDVVKSSSAELNVSLGWFMSDIWCDNSDAWSTSEIRKTHSQVRAFVYQGEIELLKNKKIMIGSPKHKNFTGDVHENTVINTIFEENLNGEKVLGDYSIFVQGIGKASSGQCSGSGPANDMIELADGVKEAIFVKASSSWEDDAGEYLNLVLETPFCGLRRFLDIDWYYAHDTFEEYLDTRGLTKYVPPPKPDARNESFGLPDPAPRKKRVKKK